MSEYKQIDRQLSEIRKQIETLELREKELLDKKLIPEIELKIQKYLTNARTTYPRDKEGVWKILGEDPNCDFGGYHTQPNLGTVSGTYQKALEYAVTQPLFFGWGSGGSVEDLKIKTL